MKKQKSKKKPIILSLMIVGCLSLSVWMLSCNGLKADNKVIDAYELRMAGHADSAVVMLDNFILENPENAVAYYERARAKKHIMKAGQGKFSIDEIIVDADKACELDPENLIYAYFCAHAKFLTVYIDLMQGKEDVKAKLDDALLAFDKTLELQACLPSSLITLTEINLMLAGEYGGDSTKAEYYAKVLEDCDPNEGLRARALYLNDEASLLEYWLKAYESHEASAIVSEELGRAYLITGDLENGKKYIEESVSLNPDNSIILIDLARASMMNAMQSGNKDYGMQAVESFKEYLELNPNAPGPIKAYVYRWMSKIYERVIGDQELADTYAEKEDELDPFCSRASGSPSLGLFVPPDVLSANVKYYSRPY